MPPKSTRQKTNEKVLLCILDGFGETKPNPGNAVKLAKTPYINHLRKNYPITLLKTHGTAVGLPAHFMGGSEVGHFTIGAGRITFQTLEEINHDIKIGNFFQNKILVRAFEKAQKNKNALHLLGMISDQGVHAQIDHLFALLKMAKKYRLKKVYIHAITDGRDVRERSANRFIKQIQKYIKKHRVGDLASIIGRYYAMDRDHNWNRTVKAYNLLTKSQGLLEKDPFQALKNYYKRSNNTDYYLDPIILNPEATIKNNDSIIFFNFRTDRARQLTQAFVAPKFSYFKRQKIKTHFVCMGPYSKIAPIVYPTPKIKNNLGAIMDKHGLKQLRIAETEKYAHVTFFFNSQIKKPYRTETRILIPSPKVPSYAEKPEMNALKITQTVTKEIRTEKFPLIVLNYANADLVGHSGNLKATIKCCEILDQYVKKTITTALKHNYHIILTADHGNADQMLYKDGSICPAHSLNPVICILISPKYKNTKLTKKQGLQDLAPTILHLLKIRQPKIMTGKSLIMT